MLGSRASFVRVELGHNYANIRLSRTRKRVFRKTYLGSMFCFSITLPAFLVNRQISVHVTPRMYNINIKMININTAAVAYRGQRTECAVQTRIRIMARRP